MAKIGLVAGSGDIPVIFADRAKARGDTVIALGIKGLTSDELESHVDRMHWFSWGALQKAILVVVTAGIRTIVLLGKIQKSAAFDKGASLDDDARKVLSAAAGKKDYVILQEVEKVLKKIGITIMDPSVYLEDLIPAAGTITKKVPTEKEWLDINYGKDVAKTFAGFDVGQTVVVKDRTVIAVEAVEGTDAAIRRSGELIGGDFVVVKMARPQQDMRFDVPLVGLDTVKAVAAAGGKVLALEAGKTFLCDREDIIKFADDKGISVVAV